MKIERLDQSFLIFFYAQDVHTTGIFRVNQERLVNNSVHIFDRNN